MPATTRTGIGLVATKRPIRSTSGPAQLQKNGALRSFDASALLLLLNIGVGAIASAPTATREIYGFDLDDPAGRLRLADALVDLLTAGIDSSSPQSGVEDS